MAIKRQDYLNFLRGTKGKDDLVLEYLSTIVILLTQISEDISKLKLQVNVVENKPGNVNDLIGAFRIQPSGGGTGSRKGPPPIIV